MRLLLFALCQWTCFLGLVACNWAAAQEGGQGAPGGPGDAGSRHFQREVAIMAAATPADLRGVRPENWSERQAAWRTELRTMLGLEPQPERSDLKVTVTAYQHHGLWFARHGVACLIIDTVQLGELHGEHHGTYKLGRWECVTRGYTPAGVEAWNATGYGLSTLVNSHRQVPTYFLKDENPRGPTQS